MLIGRELADNIITGPLPDGARTDKPLLAVAVGAVSAMYFGEPVAYPSAMPASPLAVAVGATIVIDAGTPNAKPSPATVPAAVAVGAVIVIDAGVQVAEPFTVPVISVTVVGDPVATPST